MEKPQERSFSTKEWWIGGTVLAVVIAALGGFLCHSPTNWTVTPSGMSTWIPVVLLFGCVEIGVLIFWLAARRAGYKGMPIR